jgi:penicillin-binding protein 1A
MDPVTAYQLASMMKGVVERGTATRLQSLGLPALAGKTGTTNEARDAWFIGFTPNLVAGCYIGYDTPKPMGRGAYGGTLCAPVFEAFMEVAMADRPKLEFRVPPGAVLVKVDRATGRRLPDDAAGPNVSQEAFREGQAPAVGAFTGGEIIGSAFDAAAGAGGDLPMRLSGEARSEAGGGTGAAPGPEGAPADEGGGEETSQGAGGGPQPPEPDSGGFGSGGLY